MRLTARQLNRATLARQLLLGRAPLPVAEGVRRVVAIQAQHPASPYLALWNRLAAFDPAHLDAAFADGSVVKASLLRVTLHAVHADDLATVRSALRPTLRDARLTDRRFTGTGLTAAEADALVPGLLELTREPRTTAQVQAWIEGRVGEQVAAQVGAGADTPVQGAGVWWALRCYAPLRHAPTGGPWSFGARPSYLAAATPDDPQVPGTPDGALPTLVRRYLEGFGPASVPDIAQFTGVPRSRARAAVESMPDLVQLDGPGGATLHDVPGAPLPPADVVAPPRLMAMWDSVLLAYADRSRVLPAEHRPLVIRSNGDVLPTLLVDGYVAGVWRPIEDGIEATAFRPLPGAAWDGLADQAHALVPLLRERDPRVYRRYDHWWSTLPGDHVRVLPG